jgi:hypothetical protein
VYPLRQCTFAKRTEPDPVPPHPALDVLYKGTGSIYVILYAENLFPHEARLGICVRRNISRLVYWDAAPRIDAELRGYHGLPAEWQQLMACFRTTLLEMVLREDDLWRVAAFHNVDVKKR